MSDATEEPGGFTARAAIKLVLAIQLGIALYLMGGGLASAIPHIAWPSNKPQFDTPVLPGDQTRRYRPSDMPLEPAPEGNPDRPYRSTGDMPARLAFAQEGDTLTLTGSIEEGDAQRMAEHLERRGEGLARVRLNSPGGSVRDALEIGRMVRDAELETLLGAGDICLSACPYILASGTTRMVHDSAQVGVHQHYFGTNSALPAFLAVEDIQRGQGQVMGYLDEMGIDPLMMRHALVTPPDEIYILLPEQLETYRLSTPTEG
ncbi:hypothetical protein C8N43_2119 [Litoreibacter ponti]|uniref:Periplasmic protein-like protein n=1 Tax=Litoreibacter ponti TaxID=1510457 RepID=A0A2T6BN01_9RHOB|nr:hypothetical protein [Litoreibacter ponti]PTX57449.1 hypothetical protein C8N43_2119 [Litoreibacter ponti]